jgi:hypothetical protein
VERVARIPVEISPMTLETETYIGYHVLSAVKLQMFDR